MAIRRTPPGGAQPAQHDREKTAVRIPELARRRQQQQPRVAYQEMQTRNLLRRPPADEAIPKLALQGARLPARKANPIRIQLRHMAKPAHGGKTPGETKLVMLPHHAIPANALIRPRKPNKHIRDPCILGQPDHVSLPATAKGNIQSARITTLPILPAPKEKPARNGPAIRAPTSNPRATPSPPTGPRAGSMSEPPAGAGAATGTGSSTSPARMSGSGLS